MNLQLFFEEQLREWSLARANYEALDGALSRKFDFGNFAITLLHVPARIKSTTATASSIATRACFLCAANRPAEQRSLAWRDYEILVNPYPIFRPHFTVALCRHAPQTLASRVDDMRDLAALLPEYAVFYNGANCGASAPDHTHFQIVPQSALPLINDCARGAAPEGYMRSVLHFTDDLQSVDWANLNANVIMTSLAGEVHTFVVPRKAWRPWQYSAQNESERLLISPATVEMAGVLVAPRRCDFDRITRDDIISIYSQTAF